MTNYSIVIATLDRPDDLSLVLKCILSQTLKPEKVVIADASKDNKTEELVKGTSDSLTIEYFRTDFRSSAIQRNFAAKRVTTPIIAFLDDDIAFNETLFENILPVFKDEKIGAVSPCQNGLLREDPGFFLWLYYFIQAGYYHPTYGGQLFGPGINVYPFASQVKSNLILSNWLPATLLVMRKDMFDKFRFPNFIEYSYGEDIFLTHQISREKRLFFLSQLKFDHFSRPSSFKSNSGRLISMKLENMARIAKEVMGLSETVLWLKMVFHKAFLSIVFLRTNGNRSLVKYLWKA